MSDQNVHGRCLAVLGILVIGVWSMVGHASDEAVVRGDPTSSAGQIVLEGGEVAVGPVEIGGPAGRSPLPSTHSVRIAGSTPKPRNSGPTYQTSGSGGCVYLTAGRTRTWWSLPLSLPSNATVNYLRIYTNDTSAANSQAWFTIYDLYGDIVAEFPVSSDGSGGNGYWTSALIDHQIDYNQYSYVFNWRSNVLGAEMQLCGFRIYYFDPNVFAHGFDNGDTFGWSAVVQ